MRFVTLSAVAAVFGLASADADMLQFSFMTDTGEIASFTLDTAVPNTYDPILYPNLPIRGVYLGAVHDLNFEGTDIGLSDVSTSPGETGSGQPLTIMEVGPLFNNESLSLFVIFQDPTLVTPLSSDPLAYEQSFEPFQSVLFPQIPPPRTHVDPLLTLTVNEVPEPSLAVAVAIVGLGIVALRTRGVRGVPHPSFELRVGPSRTGKPKPETHGVRYGHCTTFGPASGLSANGSNPHEGSRQPARHRGGPEC